MKYRIDYTRKPRNILSRGFCMEAREWQIAEKGTEGMFLGAEGMFPAAEGMFPRTESLSAETERALPGMERMFPGTGMYPGSGEIHRK